MAYTAFGRPTEVSRMKLEISEQPVVPFVAVLNLGTRNNRF
jgi:hypothetical protein